MNFESRIAGLERQLRWHRRIGALIVLGLVAFVAVGAASSRSAKFYGVEARAFILVNEKGETVGGLGADDDGNAALTLGPPGKPRVILMDNPDNSYLAITDKQYTPRVRIGVFAFGQAYMNLLNGKREDAWLQTSDR
jgi:hypothetical protein